MQHAAGRVTGAILAGGSSSRFSGLPKGLQMLRGERMLDRVARVLRNVTTDLLLISNADDAATWIPGVPAVPDVRAERGSVVGLHTALSSAQERVLVIAWDMPFVTTALLQLLINRGEDEAFATLPEGDHGPEPFCALYTRACLPFLDRAIDAGELRMSSALGRLPSLTRVSRAELASVGDPSRLFFNVNSPRDLELAETMSSTGRASPPA